MTDIVILDGARTAIGTFGGSLAGTSAIELGGIVAKAAMERSGVEPGQIGHVAYGTARGSQNLTVTTISSPTEYRIDPPPHQAIQQRNDQGEQKRHDHAWSPIDEIISARGSEPSDTHPNEKATYAQGLEGIKKRPLEDDVDIEEPVFENGAREQSDIDHVAAMVYRVPPPGRDEVGQ